MADSALKHGVSYEDIVHVVRTSDYLGPAADGMLWWLGDSLEGAPLEVGGITPAGGLGVVVVAHAMPMDWRRR